MSALYKLTIRRGDGTSSIRFGGRAELTNYGVLMDRIPGMMTDVDQASDFEGSAHLEGLRMALEDARFGLANSSAAMADAWRKRMLQFEQEIMKVERLMAAKSQESAA